MGVGSLAPGVRLFTEGGSVWAARLHPLEDQRLERGSNVGQA